LSLFLDDDSDDDDACVLQNRFVVEEETTYRWWWGKHTTTRPSFVSVESQTTRTKEKRKKCGRRKTNSSRGW
jgi:hypothetical protein